MPASDTKAARLPGAQSRQPIHPEGKVRLNLEVPKKLRNQLDDLVARSDATNLTEVVRRSLALYDLFLEHSSDGGDVLFRYPDGTSEVLRIL